MTTLTSSLRMISLVPLLILISILHYSSLGWSKEINDTNDTDAAAEAFAKGTSLFKKRDFVGAVDEFERAYKLRRHYAVLCSIARCYENLNKVIEATEYYRRCLVEGAEESPAAKRIMLSLKEVEGRITWIDVSSPGDGGNIYLDGLDQGTAPRRIPLNPGTHVIEVRRSGAKAASITIETRGAEQRRVTLVPIPYSINDPRTSSSSSITRQSVTESARNHHQKLLPSYWFWSTVALAAASVGAASALGVMTLRKRTAYEDNPTQEGYDRFTNFRLMTNVFWALSAVGVGSAATLYFYTDFGPSEKSSGAVASFKGCQFAIGGTF